MTTIYEPREDSYLLAHQVRKFARGNVIDIGTGSGIQAKEAASKNNVTHVVAIDINPKAIKFAKKNSQVNHKIEFFVGNLFEPVKKCRIRKFDTIIFNPPYLPDDHGKRDVALIGGRHGYEVLEKALEQVNDYLSPEGKMLIVFSSLTNKEKVEEIIKRNLLKYRVLNTMSLFFEKLYVYLIQKTKTGQTLDELGVKNIRFLAKGKRKTAYTGVFEKRKVVVKLKRPESAADTLQNEVKMLELLSKKKLSPKVLAHGKEFFVAEYIQGQFLKDWIVIATADEIRYVLKKVFEWCYALDKLGISKEEMHHPLKHVLIDGRKIGYIDFERAHYTKKPKNVSQFAQFVINYKPMLKISFDRSRLIEKVKVYKKNFGREEFEDVMEYIKL